MMHFANDTLARISRTPSWSFPFAEGAGYVRMLWYGCTVESSLETIVWLDLRSSTRSCQNKLKHRFWMAEFEKLIS